MRQFRPLALLALSCLLAIRYASATATLTSHLYNPTTQAIGQRAYIHMVLMGCAGNVPTVTSGAPSGSGTTKLTAVTDIYYDTTGSISQTIFRNDEILCGGVNTSTFYRITYFKDSNTAGPPADYRFTSSNCSGGTCTLDTMVPITILPVIVAPTGDSTYARLDGGNQPFLAPIFSPAWGSTTAGVAASGTLRFASTDTFKIRNNAGNADLNMLSKDSSDVAIVGDVNGFAATAFNNVLWVGPKTGQYSSIAACLTAIPNAVYATCSDSIGTCWQSGGGSCWITPGWTETLSANLVLQTDKSIYFPGPATINQGSFQVTAADGVCGVSIVALGPDHGFRTSGVTFNYTGNSDQFALGAGGAGVCSFYLYGIQIHAIGGGNAASPLHLNPSNYSRYWDLDLVCSSNAANTGNALKIDFGGGGSTQNDFNGTTSNFCNNPVVISSGVAGNSFTRELHGNPKGTAGPAYSIAGSNNTFINNNLLTGTFLSFYNFSGTAGGNEVINYHSAVATADVIFGASTGQNVFHCTGGSCNATDNSSATNNNTVFNTSNFKQTNAGDFTIRRLKPQSGSAVVAGDFVLSGGWGATSTVSTATGTDSAGVIIISTSGGGEGANPTVTFTYHDGTWGTNTVPIFERGPDLHNPLNVGLGCTTGPTNPVCTFAGTPGDGTTYQFNYHVFGRP